MRVRRGQPQKWTRKYLKNNEKSDFEIRTNEEIRELFEKANITEIVAE